MITDLARTALIPIDFQNEILRNLQEAKGGVLTVDGCRSSPRVKDGVL